MSLTPFQKAVDWHDEKRTAYYREVQAYFLPFQKMAAVLKIDSLLNIGLYRQIKTDSYAFIMKKTG